MHHMVDIAVKGELGNKDAKAVVLIMGHVTSHLGIDTKENKESSGLRPGEYFELRARDIYAPPGRARVLLRSPLEARRLCEGPHGQIVAKGSEQVAIEVRNDVIDGLARPGNGVGGRA